MKQSYRIDIVEVISKGEQVAFVGTPAGNFLVSYIPDAREELELRYLLARVEDINEARLKFNRMYGVK